MRPQGLWWPVWVCLLFLLTTPPPAAEAVAPAYSCRPVAQPPGGCDAACQQEIGSALLQLHAGLQSVDGDRPPWHNQSVLGLCRPHCHAVPPYCGWQGVQCCHNNDDRSRAADHSSGGRQTPVEQEMCPNGTLPGAVWKLDLTMQKLGGSLTDGVVDALKTLTGWGLHAVDFSSNNLSGTIPERLSELGPNFTTINLNFNKLTGTIPLSIRQLTNLQHVFLSFNKLRGSLNGRFCTRRTDPLEVLILRANFFTGTANMTGCQQLLLLDLTDNQLEGQIPVGIPNSKLISLRGSNNLFDGRIPDALWKLPMLTTVDMSNNQLTGSLSPFVGTSNNLVNVYLGNNSLTGTLPESIASNSQLLVLELQNNTRLYGTFPSVGALVGLRRLDIHNTSISGRIPEEWGQLPYLEYVDISGTRMSCCDNQSQADNGPTLPPFLQFSKRLLQFDLSSPRGSVRMLDETGEEASSQPNNILCRTVVRRPQPESAWNKLQLPSVNNFVDSQRWQVSPIYFWFDECTCTKFTDKSGDMYRYSGIDSWCDASYNKALNITPGPCLDMSMFVCEPLSDLLKPGIRAAIAVAGVVFLMIVGGTVAYFVLSKASKFRRFLALSATRLKGAPRSGRMTLVVTDIEGYSDIFRKAPEVMFKALVLHNSVLRAAKYHNGGFVLEQEGDSFTIAFYDPFDAVVFCLQAQQALLAVHWPPGLDQAQHPDLTSHTEPPGGSRRGSKFNMRLSPLLGLGPKLKRVNTGNSARSLSSQVDCQQPSTSHHSMFYSNLLQGAFGSKVQLGGEPLLFNGLRVRMGVVTGEVPSGTPIKNSALFQLAKVVGDFGNGGQCILDEATFAAVKEDAQALGAVDASGLNHSKLSSGRSGWNKLLRLCGCVRPHAPAEEVVLLDMGAFCQSNGDDDAELPYTTSRALDIKQQDRQQPAGPPAPWWRRLCKACSPCCRTGPDDSGDASDASPRQPSPLPPAAQASRPYLSALLHNTSSSHSVSFGASTTGAASASAGGSGRVTFGGQLSPTGFAAQQQQQQQHCQLDDAREARDAAPKHHDAGTAAGGGRRIVSFSARASRHFAELRKTLTRSSSFQTGQAAVRRDWESVRLYQVLPPALAARAHTWHNKLNLKDGWICWDNMFFEAPGSTTAPITGGSLDVFGSYSNLQPANSHNTLPGDSTTSGPGSPPTSGPAAAAAAAAGAGQQRAQPAAAVVSSVDDSSVCLQVQHTGDSDCSLAATAQALGGFGSSGSMQPPQLCSSPLMAPLPPVTMVFMAVEGPEQLVRRRRPFTPVVQALLSRVVRDALRRTGGYLCRVQEGDLKMMVAFASPVTALEWCLLVQTSAMYLQWPQSAIMLLPSCREVVDSTGRLVFRGPRIKMGVCDGVPRSILPDHEGRADYHGQSINMAARFMDKGARGGQIACTRELAEHVMAVWAAGGGSGSFSSSGSGSVSTPLAVTGFIAENQPDSLGAAAGQYQASTTTDSSCGRVQPLEIELPQEQAAAGPVTAATAGSTAAGCGGSSGGGSSNSKPRFWWGILPGASAGCVAATAGTSAPNSSDKRSASATPAAAAVVAGDGAAAGDCDAPVASACTPMPPLQLPTSPSSGSQDPQGSTGLQTALATAAAVTAGSSSAFSSSAFSSSRQLVLATSYSGPCRTFSQGFSPLNPHEAASAGAVSSAGAAAAAQSGAGVPCRERATGASWPGGVTANSQQQQQQQQTAGQRANRLAAQMRLSRSRSSSQDGAGGGNASAPGLRSSGSRLLTARTLQPVLQGQPSVNCGLLPAAPLPPAVAPSPFVMKDVVRVPFRVECHRLGLFHFKGGPPQQEMVQVLPSHLVGRLQSITADTPAPASRKGQLLQRLEGRLGQPVTVLLPELAQEYQERLPNRVSGTTGLPHRCTSPARAQSAAVGGMGPRPLADLPDFGPGDVLGSGARSSRSVSLPVTGAGWVQGVRPVATGAGAAAAAAGVAAAAGGGLGVVHSDPLFDRVSVLAATAGVVEEEEEPDLEQDTVASRQQSSGSVHTQLNLALDSQSPEPAAGSSAGGTRPMPPSHLQQDGRGSSTASSSKQAAGKPAAAAAAAGAAADSCVVDMQGMGLRHDSFGSVEEASVSRAGSLPHMLAARAPGLSGLDADAADSVHGPRSKPQTHTS